MTRILKTIARSAGAVLIRPAWLRFVSASRLVGRDRACAAISQRASRWPGLVGEYLRCALMRRMLGQVGRDVVISFGTVLTKPSAELGDGVYIGCYCVLGDVRIGANTLIGDHVCIPSGAGQHGISRVDVPIKEQGGSLRTVRIGADCWIGSGAVVLADVGDHCVVAAGAVVTRPVEEYQIVAGNPARSIGDRRTATDTSREHALPEDAVS